MAAKSPNCQLPFPKSETHTYKAINSFPQRHSGYNESPPQAWAPEGLLVPLKTYRPLQVPGAATLLLLLVKVRSLAEKDAHALQVGNEHAKEKLS